MWRSLDEVAGHRRVQGLPAPRVPEQRLGVARSGRPPQLPEADERVDGARRRHRVHGAAAGTDRSVRPPARRRNSRQAAVLRDRDDARRRRHRACSSKATKAGRRRSKAIPIIRRARARPTCSRRARCSRCTIRIARRRSPQLGEIRPWSAAIAAIRGGLSAQSASKGAGLRILTETVASPTLAAQIQQVLALQPGAKWIQWEPVNRDNARAGARTAFGQYVEPLYDLTKADVILSLDADFLSSDGAHNLLLHAPVRDAPPRRRKRRQSQPPLRRRIGSHADRRPRRQSPAAQVEPDRSVRARGRRGRRRQRRQRHGAGGIGCVRRQRSRRIWSEHKGRAVVMAGDSQPPAVHALAHAINAAIGAPVSTCRRRKSCRREQSAALHRARLRHQRRPRADAGDRRRIESRSYSAPADLKFAEAMRKVSLVVHSGLFFDETATLSHWHIPAAHYLEAWSDARTIDGTVSIVQPLIQPLYGGKSAHEVIATMSDRPERDRLRRRQGVLAGERAGRCTGCARCSRCRCNGARVRRGPHQVHQRTGSTRCTRVHPLHLRDAFEKSWRKWLHDGFIAGSAAIAGDGDRGAGCGDAHQRQADADRRPRDQLPPRPDDLRRTLREQRLAAGIAEADDEADVGQRRADRAGDRRSQRPAQRRHDRDPARTAAALDVPVFGSSRATPRTRSRSRSATAARAPAASATAPASTPTRCADRRRCSSARRR